MAKWKVSNAARLLKSGGLGAVALALAAMTLPADAFAQNGERGSRWNNGQQSAQSQRTPQAQPRGNWNNRSGTQATQAPRRPIVQNRDASAGSPNWRGNNGQRSNAPAAAPNPNRNWGGNAQRSDRNGNANSAGRSEARNARIIERQQQRQAASRDNAWTGRNRSYAAPDRNQGYRPDRPTVDRNVRRDDNDNRWRTGERWKNDNRNDRTNRWRNDNRWNQGRWDNDNNRRWNRDWRRDNRYNWQHYRNSNRNIYRIGHYYAPYRNYSYRRLSAGFYLDSMFFGSRYLINDPWHYRLPPADGAFRWVRYYNDALLVDTYTGEVVDVIHDLFW